MHTGKKKPIQVQQSK